MMSIDASDWDDPFSEVATAIRRRVNGVFFRLEEHAEDLSVYCTPSDYQYYERALRSLTNKEIKRAVQLGVSKKRICRLKGATTHG